MNSTNEDITSKTGLWYTYKSFIADRIIGDKVYNTRNISYWRDRLFTSIITYFIPCCFIALVPGVVMSFVSGHWFIGLMDLIAFASILSITILKKLSLTFRKLSFIAITYCFSVALILSLSLFGPGMIYLLTVCVLTTIILPKIWGYISAFANIFICISCAVIINLNVFASPLQSYNLWAWIAVCSNLVFLSFVVVAVLSHAIEGLENTLLKESLLRVENIEVIRNHEHNEQRLKQAQALAHLGSWELNISTGIALWSEEACRIYGLSPEDSIQSYDNWIAYNHPDDIADVMKITGEAWETVSNASFFHRILRKDGRVRHLYTEARCELDEDGQPIGMYGITHDVTELKENQEELRKSNERFELVNLAAREAIIDWDIVDNVIFWGNGFTEIFGYSPSDYHGHLLTENIHPEDRDEALEALHKNLADPTKIILYREFRYLKADRSVAYVQLRTVLIRDSSGQALRAVSSLMDVTNLVINSKALEKQNVALRDIAWIQSHVLRSPLASIMGLVDLLKHKDEHGIDEEHLINEIQATAEKLDEVIHDIVRKTEAMEHTFEWRASSSIPK